MYFIFIMLYYSFNNFYFLLPFLYFFLEFWFLFFKINLDQKIKNFKKDFFNKINLFYKQNFFVFININIYFLVHIITYLFILKGSCMNFFWNHLLLNNFLLYLMFSTYLINFILFLIVKQLAYTNVSYSYDYFFSLINLSIFLPLLFLSNGVFSFFFLLELNSCIIFYKLVVSKLWYNNISNSSNKFSKVFSKNYLNLIFYQFWVTFFSTVLILFFFINLNVMFGSANWAFINYILYINNNINFFFNKMFLVILSLLFVFSFFIKVGVAPLHFFKIEIYKSIPYLSILFYTTYYLSVFLFFLLYFMSNLYLSFFFYIWFVFLIILVFGSFFLISLIFDVNLIKSFFAYSTIINTINFVILMLINLI